MVWSIVSLQTVLSVSLLEALIHVSNGCTDLVEQMSLCKAN